MYHKDILHTYRNHTIGDWPWSTFMYDDSSTEQLYLEDVTISAPSPASNFSIYGWGLPNTTMPMSTLIFDRMFPAFTTVANDSTQETLRKRLGSITEVRTAHLAMNPWLLPNNITTHLERLSTAMTNVIRPDPSSGQNIPGDAFIVETYVVVHWAWLARVSFSWLQPLSRLLEVHKGILGCGKHLQSQHCSIVCLRVCDLICHHPPPGIGLGEMSRNKSELVSAGPGMASFWAH
jgi:hypothetical protein